MLTWTTDQVANGEIEYGTTASYGSVSGYDSNFVLTDTRTLTHLTPNTLYHYRIKTRDAEGNVSVTPDNTFTTNEIIAIPEVVVTNVEVPVTVSTNVAHTNTSVTTPSLIISSIDVASVGSYEATVSWHTNLLSDAQVEYGNSELFGSTLPLDTGLGNEHMMTITGLSPNTNYIFRVKSKPAGVLVATVSSNHEFNTLPLPRPTDPPANVSSVQASDVAPTTATVTWSTDKAATTQVEYGLSTTYGEASVRNDAFETSHTVHLSDLAQDTTYHYRVKSVDNAANITYSDDHVFTTGLTVAVSVPIVSSVVSTIPATINLLTVSGVVTSSGAISWVTDQLTSGKIEYGLTSSYGQETHQSASVQLTHTASLFSLSPNTTYHFRVKTINETGDITYSDDQTLTTESLPSLPTIVILPEPTVSIPLVSAAITTYPIMEATPSTALVIWSTNQTTTGQVQYGLTTNYGQQTPTSTTGLLHDATLSNLTPNTLYHYRVKAVTNTGGVVLTDDETLLTPALPSVPSILPSPISSTTTPVTLALISDISVSGITTSTASVVWNTDQETTGQVEYGISSAYGQQSILDSSLQTAHGIILSGLVPGTTYHYRVNSVGGSGPVVHSTDATFTTEDLLTASIVVAAPASVTTLSVSSHDQSSATLAWDVASPHADAATEYDIRYDKEPITDANFAAATPAQSTPIYYVDLQPNAAHRTYVVAGLDANTTYYFALKSTHEHSDWSWISSNRPSVKTESPATVSPTAATSAPSSGATASSESASGGSSSNGNSSASSGHGGVGSVHSSSSAFVEAPILINASGEDSQIVFTWKNPNLDTFVRTVLVKKDGGYPTSPRDGQTLYEGRSETFTDTGLTNGVTYYYALYTYNQAKISSAAVNVSLPAIATNNEVVFNENPQIAAATTVDHFVQTLKLGSQDLEVEHLQQILAADGKLYPEKLITGYFGVLTQNGLKNFQAKHRLPQTKITDEVTREKLNVVSQSLVNVEIPGDLAVFTTDLRFGQTNDEVANLQELLAIEGFYKKDIATGSFDAYTKNAVIAFQKKYFVQPASGYVGYKTRHVIEIISGL